MTKINYDQLMRDSLKYVVRRALNFVAKRGLCGKQHLLITFRVDHPGVVVPHYLYDQYPDELTIILENQFWDLEVQETGFSVSLSFNGKTEAVRVPYDALTEFQDPSEDFVLMFDPIYEEDLDEEEPEVKVDQSASNVISIDAFKNK